MSNQSTDELKKQVQILKEKIKALKEENQILKKTEKKLLESQIRYEEMVERSKNAVAVYNPINDGGDFIIIGFNKAAEKIDRVNRKDIIGKRVVEVFPGVIEFGLFDVFKRVYRTGVPESYPVAFYKDNRIRGWRENYVYRLPSGEIVAVYTDETEKKKIEEELWINEEIFKLFMEHSPIYVFFKDENIRSLKLSKNYEKMIGKPLSELIGKNMDDLFPSELAKSMVEDDKRILREKKPITVSEKLGGRTYDTIKFPIMIDGKPRFLAGFTIDVTEQIKAEEEIKNINENLKLALEAGKAGTWDWDIVNNTFHWSDEFLRIFGMDSTVQAGFEAWTKVVHPEDRETAAKRIQDSITEKKDLINEYRIVLPNQEIRWIRSIGKTFYTEENKPSRMAGLCIDSTEHKQAEDILRKSEKNLSEAQRIARLGSFEYDFRANALFWSEEIFRIFGIAPEKFTGKVEDFLNIIHPDDREQVRRLREKSLLRGGKGDFEHRIVRPDGSIRIVHERYETSFAEDGRPLYRTGTVQDITESKLIENALKESENKYRSLFNKMANGLAYCQIIVDENNQPVDWIYLDVNEAFDEITHLKKDIIGKKVTEAIPGIKQDVPELFKIYGDVAMTGEEKRFEIYLHTLEIWFSIIAFSPQKGYFVAIFEDITDRKKAEEEKKNLEEQLFQSQKMESIGRLAGGVAHDFNNILTGIMGYAELLQMQFEDKSTQEGEAVDVIIRGAERAADLTQQLLGFARGGKYNPVPLKINEVIKECIKVSEKIFEKNITVKYQLFQNIDTIEADKNQMHQVLTNIIINARDAMPDGGEVLLSTENVFIDREYVTNHPEFKSGQYVKISISDTGIGMPRAVKNRIFEPFYTTKGRGKGTGLGLATVYGIIKNHNGHIHVYSEPGIGTTFTIYLPVSGKEIIEERREQKIIKGDATVLIVDDEENIRMIAQKQLESLGYKVLTAGNGNEAITILKENSDKIDIVLLDMIMPDLGGKETYRKLKQINPELKVVIISGFSQNGKASELLHEGAAGFIQKPFKMFELSDMISETLRM